MRRAWLLAVGLALVVATTGCSVDQAAPTCEPEGRNTLVLLAQSVPTATRVPCVDHLPSGWFVERLEVKSGGSALTFRHNTFGDGFLIEVALRPECDTGDAVSVPSDEQGAERLEEVSSIEGGYAGMRYYVFEGGCVTYRFDVRGEGWSSAINDASLALTFESRDVLEEYVRTSSRGVITDL